MYIVEQHCIIKRKNIKKNSCVGLRNIAKGLKE